MNNWPLIKIADFTNVLTGGTPSTRKTEYWAGGHIPWINSGALNNKEVVETDKFITEEGLKNSAAKLMPAETVLIALTGTTTGQSSILRFEASANQSVTGILPSENHNSKYLLYYLKSIRQKIKSVSWGGAQKHINQQFVKDLKVPLPPLKLQDRIVRFLDKADTLRQKRKESIKLLDDYLRSTFLEMFGDSFLNDKNWPTINLKDSCHEVVDCPHSTPKYSGINEIYPCIRTTEIRDGHIDWSSMKYVDEIQYNERTKRLKPLPGDIIYGREGSFGDAIVIPKNEKMCLGQRVMLFRPNPEMYNNLFFWCLIRSKGLFHMALQKNNGATVGHVNVGDIKLFSLIKPPMELQTKFADIVQQVEKLKAKYKESEKELDNLFGSLMQRAFRGEL